MTWENMIVPAGALAFALIGLFVLFLAKKSVVHHIENGDDPPPEEPVGPTEESLLNEIKEALAKRNT